MSSASYRYLCGVERPHCSGSIGPTSHALDGKIGKMHNSPSDAFDCMVGDLLRQGWTRVDSRAFRSPEGYEGGPVTRVLTKRSRYGSRLRKGKGSEKGGSATSRHMPSRPRTGGIIASY